MGDPLKEKATLSEAALLDLAARYARNAKADAVDEIAKFFALYVIGCTPEILTAFLEGNGPGSDALRKLAHSGGMPEFRDLRAFWEETARLMPKELQIELRGMSELLFRSGARPAFMFLFATARRNNGVARKILARLTDP